MRPSRRASGGAGLLAFVLLCAVALPIPPGSGSSNAAETTATFGKTSVGASADRFATDRKRVSVYTLPVAGALSKLSIYMQPTTYAGQQVLKGVVYADAVGTPGALLGTSTQTTFTSTSAAGWYSLSFSTPLQLAAGNYWLGVITGSSYGVIGFRYDTVTGVRKYNSNLYTSGPSNPFGSAITTDNEQMSLYATYTPSAPPAKPVNTAPPTISGTTQVGSLLSSSTGSWTNSPSSYTYAWERCDSTGAACAVIGSGASASTYTLVSADAGHTLRVSMTASNAGGTSAPATSAQSAVVAAAPPTQHLEYVFDDGTIYVYDMDQAQKLVNTISLPQTTAGIRGATASPGTHMLFISYGGDGGVYGNGSVLAYDLLANKVVWTVHLNTGIDSGAVSPDGKRLYMPTGENTTSGIWNILDTSNGAVIGTIQGGTLAHNTVASNDGRYVYLGGRNYNYLDVYDTTTGKVRGIGPLLSGVRPFTVNGSNTLAFTTATGVDGFQVSSITTGKVLYTISFGSVPPGFPFSAPSHGASLSPDEKQLYVIDSVNREVHVYDVSKVAQSVAPTQIAAVPVPGLTGTETPCAYDCTRGGWVQHSLDGRFVYVGDSGAVIETATRKILTTLTTLQNSKKTLEIDWANGVPVATSGRTGVGYVG